jgi:ABC-2 type transport system ATP-binding protein
MTESTSIEAHDLSKRYGTQLAVDALSALSALIVTDLDARRIAQLAAARGLVLYELAPQRASLEDAFRQLTHDSVEYDGARR